MRHILSSKPKKWILVIITIGLIIISMLNFKIVSTCCGYQREDPARLENLARSGDLIAAEKLAFYFEEAGDKSRRLLWMQLAAKQGSFPAKIDLFDELQLGEQVDPQETVTGLIEAANTGCPDAQYKLANAYSAGNYVALDKQAMLNFLWKASLGGKPEAMYQYAKEGRQNNLISMTESAAWLELAKEYVKSNSFFDKQITEELKNIKSNDLNISKEIKARVSQLEFQVRTERDKRKSIRCTWED